MRISDWSSDVCSSDLPNAPWTLPSRMRRAEGSMSAVAAPGAAGASGGGSRRGSRVGLGRFLVQVADLVGQLRALPDPVVDAGDVQLDALLGARGDGVVETHALDVAAVARAALEIGRAAGRERVWQNV